MVNADRTKSERGKHVVVNKTVATKRIQMITVHHFHIHKTHGIIGMQNRAEVPSLYSSFDLTRFHEGEFSYLRFSTDLNTFQAAI